MPTFTMSTPKPKRTASKSTAVDVYDAETKTMSAAAPLPSGRMFHAVATTSSMGVDTLFVGGGTDDDDVTNASAFTAADDDDDDND